MAGLAIVAAAVVLGALWAWVLEDELGDSVSPDRTIDQGLWTLAGWLLLAVAAAVGLVVVW